MKNGITGRTPVIPHGMNAFHDIYSFRFKIQDCIPLIICKNANETSARPEKLKWNPHKSGAGTSAAPKFSGKIHV